MLLSLDYIMPLPSEQELLSHRERLEHFKAQSDPIPRSQAIAIGEDAIRMIETGDEFHASIRRMLAANANIFLLLGALSGISWWLLRAKSAN